MLKAQVERLQAQKVEMMTTIQVYHPLAEWEVDLEDGEDVLNLGEATEDA